MNTLQISRLTKIFKKNPILNKIELELNQREIIGILGRNGSGKTPLLKSIFGTLKADSIQLEINEKVISPNKIISTQQVGFLP